MSTSKRIINILRNIPDDGTLKKIDKIFIRDNLLIILDDADDQDIEQLDTMIDLFSQGILTQDDKKLILEMRDDIIEIVKAHENEFHDEIVKNIIDENSSVEKIETFLDTKVPKYKFTDDHPMKGVSYLKSKNLYQVNHNDIKSGWKDLSTACKKVKESMMSRLADGMIIEDAPKKSFRYKDHNFITYWHNNNPMFDIHHIISVLNLHEDSSSKKYKKYSENVEHYCWHKNQFGGYSLRELISEKTVYKIILSSNSELSKNFKNDVADILINLRNKGQLIITNEKISKNPIKIEESDTDDEGVEIEQPVKTNNEIKKKKRPVNKNLDISNDNKIIINHPQLDICCYDSPGLNYALFLITLGTLSLLGKFVGICVLYAFIIPLKLNHSDIIIKFGFTDNIVKRMGTLATEYGCKVYFVAAKLIQSKTKEEEFHSMLHRLYPNHVQKYRIGKTEKIELYKLCPALIEAYKDYNDQPCTLDRKKEDGDIKLTADNQGVVTFLKEQETHFRENIKENKGESQMTMLKEKHNHDLLMRDKDIEVLKVQNIGIEVQSDADLTLRDHDLAIKAMDLEMEKIQLEKLRIQLPKFK